MLKTKLIKMKKIKILKNKNFIRNKVNCKIKIGNLDECSSNLSFNQNKISKHFKKKIIINKNRNLKQKIRNLYC